MVDGRPGADVPHPSIWSVDYCKSAKSWYFQDHIFINKAFFKFNYFTGYYRVHYKNALLDAIIDQLWRDHTVFDVQVRSTLVDDNINLGYAGWCTVRIKNYGQIKLN